MDYKLLKELKAKGFPFQEVSQDNVGRSASCVMCNQGFIRIGKQTFLIPTLSQLIETCGDTFENVGRCSQSPKKGDWHAISKRLHKEGKTRKIAVAKLFIALSK